MSDKPRVLFICTHNAARSQMAEALLRHHASDRFAACSAGFTPTEVHPFTEQVLRERGIDAAGLHAKSLKEFLARVSVRYCIIVCAQHEDSCPRIFPFSLTTLTWPFDDPALPERTGELQLAKFRRIRDEIDARLWEWLRTA